MIKSIPYIKLAETNACLETLHQFSYQLLRVKEEREIYIHISNALKKIFPKVFFAVSKLQNDNKNFRIVESAGFDTYFKGIKKIIGKDPFEIDFPLEDLSDEKKIAFDENKLYYFEDGIYELANGVINKTACKAIEKLLGISKICAVSFCVEKQYFGGMTIFITKSMINSGQFNSNSEKFIESIAYQASTLIQRLRVSKELIKNENILNLANLKIETLFENSSTGYLFSDETRTILKVNHAFYTIFNIPEEYQLVGLNCSQVIESIKGRFKNSDKFENKTTKIVQNNKPCYREEICMENGKILERDFIPLNNQTLKGFLWQYRDITEHKNHETKLKKQAKTLKKLNNTKDKFFSIIAHDLKSPYSSLIGLTEILTKNYTQFTDTERIKYLGLLKDTSKNAFKLTENLLGWAQLQKGQIKFKPENINLNLLVGECIKIYFSKAIEKEIIVRNEIQEDLIIVADKNAISTVFRNLFSNSLKYTPHQGSIIFRSRKTNSNFVTVHLIDNGIGMNPQKIKKLFKIEENVTTPGISGEKGTGLGLILCKELLLKNRGKIEVKSEPEKGTEFKIRLPLLITPK